MKDFTWEQQNEFGKCLNPLKESGYDWRTVAYRLQLTWIIQRLERKLNPTVEMLRECTETTSKELLEILVDVGRTDVIDYMLKFFDRGLSWRLQDSGNSR